MGPLDIIVNALQYAGVGAGVGGAIGAGIAYVVPMKILPLMNCGGALPREVRDFVTNETQIVCGFPIGEVVAVFRPEYLVWGALVGALIGFSVAYLSKPSPKPTA